MDSAVREAKDLLGGFQASQADVEVVELDEAAPPAPVSGPLTAA